MHIIPILQSAGGTDNIASTSTWDNAATNSWTLWATSAVVRLQSVELSEVDAEDHVTNKLGP